MDAAQPSRRRPRWLFRFSLFGLLLVMTGTAGYFSGYRWGATQRVQDDYNASSFSKVYYVADLVRPTPNALGEPKGNADFAPLIDLITSTIASETWAVNGAGEGEVRPYPPNLSMVVSNNGRAHDQLAELLQQLRDLRFKLPNGYLGPIREAVNRKLEAGVTVKLFRSIDPGYHQSMENFFATAMSDLTQEYGRPAIVVGADEKGFPDWAAAQRIAVWNRRGGKLYLALRDCLPQGEALVAGWWEESFGAMQPIKVAPPVIASTGSKYGSQSD